MEQLIYTCKLCPDDRICFRFLICFRCHIYLPIADHMHKVIDSEIGTELLSSVEAGNFVGLALYDAGTRNFYNSVRPIKTVEDMKGLKIRTTQSQLIVDMVEALGASAISDGIR